MKLTHLLGFVAILRVSGLSHKANGVVPVPAILIKLGARSALIGCVGLTLWGALSPAGQPHLHLFPWDKAEHFSAFFALTVTAIVAFPQTRLVVIAAALSFGGAAIELVQALPWVNRDCDYWDWVADTTAILAVAGVDWASQLRLAARASQLTLNRLLDPAWLTFLAAFATLTGIFTLVGHEAGTAGSLRLFG